MLPQGKRHPVPSWKVSIGEFYDDHPARDDKFTIRERTRLTSGSKAETRYVVHDGMMARLFAACERVGIPIIEVPNRDPQKPPLRKVLSVPVLTPYNTVEEAVFSEMAVWASGRYICHCGQFGLKTRTICEQQGLPTPVPSPEKAGREYFVGVAERFFWSGDPMQQTFHCEATQKVTCDPATCPFATGRWDKPGRELYKSLYGRFPTEKQIGPNADRKLCGPQVIVPVLLPFVETESPRAVFVNHAWGSGGALERTYQEIRAATGGVMCGIPLRLDLLWRECITPGGKQEVPVVQFGTLVPWADLPQLGQRVSAELAGTGRLMGEVQEQLLALEGVVEEHTQDPEVALALQREFAAGTQEDESFGSAVEARFRERAARCQWSPVKVNQFLAACDEREVYDQLRAFEEQLGLSVANKPGNVERLEVPSVVTEAKAEEVPEDVVDADFTEDHEALGPSGDAEKLQDPEDPFYKPPVEPDGQGRLV